MQAMAAENNLAETAFFVRRADGDFDLRWFTPTVEVDLCGHATLATALVAVRSAGAGAPPRSLPHPQRAARRRRATATRWRIDFPARPPSPAEPRAAALAAALGPARRARRCARATSWRCSSAPTRCARSRPTWHAVAALDAFGVIVTAPGDGDGVDFVSRFFAPAKGIPEDPVTGSAHCTLVPYWAERLGKSRLRARQVSRRGGDLACELARRPRPADRSRHPGQDRRGVRGKP